MRSYLLAFLAVSLAACAPTSIGPWDVEDLGPWYADEVEIAARDLLACVAEVDGYLAQLVPRVERNQLSIFEAVDPAACGEICDVECWGCSSPTRAIWIVPVARWELEVEIIAHELLHQIMLYDLMMDRLSHEHDPRYFGPDSVLDRATDRYWEKFPEQLGLVREVR